MYHKPIAQILKETARRKSFDNRVEYLREHSNPILLRILKCMFDPAVKFMLPEGPLPDGLVKIYKTSPPLALYSRTRLLYLFIEGESPENLTQKKREMLFIQFMEGLPKTEADIIYLMKDKKGPSNITANLINTAFPDLIGKPTSE